MNESAIFGVHYDLGLVEESVLRAVRALPRDDQAAFHRERDILYEVADPDQREMAFERLHRHWFLRLRLDAPLDRALAEHPSLAKTTAGCWILRVTSRRDEMADLVRRRREDSPAIAVRLCPDTFQDPDGLLRLLRHEFLHLSDMLDPRFGYQRELPASDAGPSHDNLVRERYRVVWDATIDGRLVRRRLLPASSRERRLQEFARAFPMLADLIELEFERWFDSDHPRHDQILAFALNPRGVGIEHTACSQP